MRITRASSTVISLFVILIQICVAARKAPMYSSLRVRKYRRSFLDQGSCSSSFANLNLQTIWHRYYFFREQGLSSLWQHFSRSQQEQRHSERSEQT